MGKSGRKNYKSIRDGFREGLLQLGQVNPNVFALSADLAESVRMYHFAKKYPDRFIQVGVAEQNMAGIAVGLALEGKIPYVGTFACFQPMRNLDQIRTSICMMNANVKLVSSHAGFSYPADGIQIQALEDIAIMRTLPNMKVLVPADAVQARELAIQASEIDGPVYIRLGRAETEVLSTRYKILDTESESKIRIGKAQTLRMGSDATIFANGYMVALALEVAAELAGEGIHTQVVNMHTVKPLDDEIILEAAENTGRIVTIEEHQKSGGLGSAVAEVLSQSRLAYKMRILGVEDQFGETAKRVEELREKHGLTKNNLRDAVMELVKY